MEKSVIPHPAGLNGLAPQVQQGTMGIRLAYKELQAQLQPEWGQEQMFN